MLKLSDGTCILRDIAKAIAKAFEADNECVAADVFRFASTLLARGVVFVAGRRSDWVQTA